MIKVAYFDPASGVVSRLLSGPTLFGMPDPNAGELAVLTDYPGRLPAFVDRLQVLPMADRPSDDHVWSATHQSWEVPPDQEPVVLQKAIHRALDAVDSVAGEVRLRYITSVPGQSETYTRKEAQAREWADSGFTGSAPSFIAAEAQALGVEPQQVAQEVIALADFWSNQKGPAIEAARIAGKAAVRTAATLQQLSDLERSAIQALQLL